MRDAGKVDRLRRGLIVGAAGSVLSTRIAFADDASPESRLKSLGLELPAVSKPIANFVQFSRGGNIIFVSGQLPLKDGKILNPGKVGSEVSPDQAKEAAKLCAINVLTVAQSACDGDLSRIKGCLRLEGFVACVPSFTAQPTIINGASDLVVSVLGEAGKHARFAVGVAALPLDAPVEVAAIFLLA